MHCAWPGDYHSLSLTRIQYHPSNVTPLTNLLEVTAPGKSNAWGWHNSHQSGIIGITDKLIQSRIEKSSEVYRRNNNRPKTLPCSTLSWHHVNQFSLFTLKAITLFRFSITMFSCYSINLEGDTLFSCSITLFSCYSFNLEGDNPSCWAVTPLTLKVTTLFSCSITLFSCYSINLEGDNHVQLLLH